MNNQIDPLEELGRADEKIISRVIVVMLIIIAISGIVLVWN